MSADLLWTICVAGLITIGVICAWAALTIPFAVITGRRIAAADKAADDAWAHLLAAVDITPEQMRDRWEGRAR